MHSLKDLTYKGDSARLDKNFLKKRQCSVLFFQHCSHLGNRSRSLTSMHKQNSTQAIILICLKDHVFNSAREKVTLLARPKMQNFPYSVIVLHVKQLLYPPLSLAHHNNTAIMVSILTVADYGR